MPLDFQIDYDSGLPVYRQIHDAVLTAIGSGRLKRDEQLPTIHELARRLEVNPNTVAKAYRDLEQRGILEAVRGRGTFPAAGKALPHQDREAVLKSIYERALAEATRHGVREEEIIALFQRRRS